jgi:hypothetical protein
LEDGFADPKTLGNGRDHILWAGCARNHASGEALALTPIFSSQILSKFDYAGETPFGY